MRADPMMVAGGARISFVIYKCEGDITEVPATSSRNNVVAAGEAKEAKVNVVIFKCQGDIREVPVTSLSDPILRWPQGNET